MYASDRINALLQLYGLQPHGFICGRGSHSALDHLDMVAKMNTRVGHVHTPDTWPRSTVGQRIKMHEARVYWWEVGKHFHLGELIEGLKAGKLANRETI